MEIALVNQREDHAKPIFKDITLTKRNMYAKSFAMGDVKEMETTIKQSKSVLIPVGIAAVSQIQDPAEQVHQDFTLTKIIKLAKNLLMEAAMETTTTSTLRSSVLKPAKKNQ